MPGRGDKPIGIGGEECCREEGREGKRGQGELLFCGGAALRWDTGTETSGKLASHAGGQWRQRGPNAGSAGSWPLAVPYNSVTRHSVSTDVTEALTPLCHTRITRLREVKK